MESKRPERSLSGEVQLPESPLEPMQFLSRSWSPSAFQISKTLVAPTTPKLVLHKKHSTSSTTANATSSGANSGSSSGSKIEEVLVSGGFQPEESAVLSGNTFSFASSATSQLVLERIMCQSVCLLSFFLKTTINYINLNTRTLVILFETRKLDKE